MESQRARAGLAREVSGAGDVVMREERVERKWVRVSTKGPDGSEGVKVSLLRVRMDETCEAVMPAGVREASRKASRSVEMAVRVGKAKAGMSRPDQPIVHEVGVAVPLRPNMVTMAVIQRATLRVVDGRGGGEVALKVVMSSEMRPMTEEVLKESQRERYALDFVCSRARSRGECRSPVCPFVSATSTGCSAEG